MYEQKNGSSIVKCCSPFDMTIAHVNSKAAMLTHSKTCTNQAR